MVEEQGTSDLCAVSGLPRITRAQVRSGSLVLAIVAGTVASSAFNFVATLYRDVPGSDPHGYHEGDAWLILLASPIISVLGICLSVPLIAAADRLDGTAHHRADRSITRYDLLLPLTTLIVLVGTYSFLAVPHMSSVMAGKSFLANVLAMPESVFDVAPVYLCGALVGTAVYIIAARWMVRTSSL